MRETKSLGSASWLTRKVASCLCFVWAVLLLSCSPTTEAETGQGSTSSSESAALDDSPQVFLSAFIVEASESVLTASYESLKRAASGDISGLFAGDGAIEQALEKAEKEGRLTILARPTGIVDVGQTFSMQSGDQIPIQTVSNDTTSVQFVNATLQCYAVVTLRADGRLRVDATVMRRFPLNPGEMSNAPIHTTEMRLHQAVADGGTAVARGIYDTTQGRRTGPELIVFITARRVS